MFIVMAGEHCRQERGELDWTFDNVVSESHTEVLERAVIVAIVNRFLMGKGPVVFTLAIRQADADRKFVGNAVVEFLDDADSTNVSIVVTRPVAVVMVLVEQILITEGYFSFAVGRHPRLGESGRVKEQYDDGE